jgi:hypothetical protein
MVAEPDFRALEDFSSSKESFHLREYRDAINPGSNPFALLHDLLPELSRLRLAWRQQEGDIIIFRHPRSDPLIPGRKEMRAAEAWLTGGEMPPDIQRLVEEYIARKTGKPWDDPVTLQRIRTSVMQQKSQYWKEREKRKIGYRKGYAVFAYLAYHAPVTFFQFSYFFLKLIREGLIPERVRILDAGTGPGVVPLAISGLLRKLTGLSAEIFALERSEEFIDAYCQLVPKYAKQSAGVTIHPPVKGDIREADSLLLPSSVDLIVMQNVLNELPGGTGEKARVITSCSRLLTPEGCMAIIEPADRENSTALRKNVNAATGIDLVVRDPCRFLWGGSCKAGSCWSFQERPSISPTRLMKALAGEKEAFRFQNTDIKFSYAVLVKDRQTTYTLPVSKGVSFLPLSSLRRHTGEKVNIIAAVMSGDIGDPQNHVFLICDGTATAYAILPRYHVTPGNRVLLAVSYSSVVEFRRVLVRYNRNYRAWNLLISKNSSVRQATGLQRRTQVE